MSMTVEQRRTVVLSELGAPAIGKLRMAKASSKYDRRRRYLVVEWCPPEWVGTDLEEHAYRVLRDWHPASTPANLAAAREFQAGAFRAFRELRARAQA
jgi:hypothetical protein